MFKNKKYGFTLTEVIIVIVIIGALALILIPNMVSLMPDDHNVKYKKAFYTIQEVVNDIANQCQGMSNDGSGNWSAITEADANNVLNYCYRGDTARFLADEICSRLSTTNECRTAGTDNSMSINTTNNMYWFIPARSLDTNFDEDVTIYVNVDGKQLNAQPVFSNVAANNSVLHEAGTFRIIISPTGKVKAPVAITGETGNESDYLSANPMD